MICIVCKREVMVRGKTCGRPECIRAFADYVNATPIPRQDGTTWAQSDQSVEAKDDRESWAAPVRERRGR